MRAWLLLGLCACTTVPTVTANPVPPAETLRAADCAAAASVYQALLVKPVASPLAQSRAGLPSAQAFTTTCTGTSSQLNVTSPVLGPPGGLGLLLAAPTIAVHGTPEQIARYAPCPVLVARPVPDAAKAGPVPFVNAGFESLVPGRRGDPEGWFTFQHAGDKSYHFVLDTWVSEGTPLAGEVSFVLIVKSPHRAEAIAAMLAGVLETVAVYTVLRSKALVDQALPPTYTGNLLLTFGLLSFVVASLFILIQHNYKRLFAYSSIEHMGLAMIGFGVGGPLGTFAGLFHLLNHAVAKALAFFVAGNVHRRFETLEINEVRGVAQVQPITAVAMLVAGCALVGLPPFSPFVSELLVVSAVAAQDFASDTMEVGRFVTMTISDEMRSLGIVALLLFFAVVLFGGFMFRIGTMVWGAAPDGITRGEVWTVGHVPLMIMIVALLGFGFVLPEPIHTLLTRAVNVIVMR